MGGLLPLAVNRDQQFLLNALARVVHLARLVPQAGHLGGEVGSLGMEEVEAVAVDADCLVLHRGRLLLSVLNRILPRTICSDVQELFVSSRQKNNRRSGLSFRTIS